MKLHEAHNKESGSREGFSDEAKKQKGFCWFLPTQYIPEGSQYKKDYRKDIL
jgi:hypothetical protein